MSTEKLFEKIGLALGESAVYLALLELGPSSVSDISLRAKMHRPAVYRTLLLLKERGLVSVVARGKRKLYAPASPEKLRDTLAETESSLNETLPELLAAFGSRKNRPSLTYLEGRKGIIAVFRDIVTTLKKGDVFYRYSSSKQPRKADYYIPHNYVKLRDEKQLERFVITNDRSRDRKKPKLEKAVRIVPKDYDLFEYDITQLIYADKIAFVDYNTETAIIIENKIIAEFQKKIFKLLFQEL